MNELQVFKFEGNREVRTLERNGEPWWGAKDVAEALGYASNNITQIISHVPNEWKGSNRIATPSGSQEMQCLSEQGLYFFLGRSDKDTALPFQKWIAGEVIPSIRKTGAYALSGRESPDKGANYFAWEAAVGRVAENRMRTVLAQVMGRAALPEYRDISNIVDAHRTLSKVWSVIERLPKRTPTTETQRDKLLTLITKAKGFLEKEFRK